MKLIEQVKEHLEGARGRWPEISRETGVPYSTIAKLVQGQVTNPRIETIEPLLAYFNHLNSRRITTALSA